MLGDQCLGSHRTLVAALVGAECGAARPLTWEVWPPVPSVPELHLPPNLHFTGQGVWKEGMGPLERDNVFRSCFTGALFEGGVITSRWWGRHKWGGHGTRSAWRLSGPLASSLAPPGLADPRRQVETSVRPLARGGRARVGPRRRPGPRPLSTSCPSRHPLRPRPISERELPSPAAMSSPPPSSWWSMGCSIPSWSRSWRQSGAGWAGERAAPAPSCQGQRGSRPVQSRALPSHCHPCASSPGGTP